MQAAGPAPDVSGLRSALKQAKNIAALTGAGISAESGVPTFRSTEGLWEWERAVEAATQAEIFLVIGTSAMVYPAAGLASIARQSGARLALVNKEPTLPDDIAKWVVQGPSGEVLPRLL